MIAHSPTIDPTDRSMPPVMMMNVIGKASRPTSVINRPWFSRLSMVRKRSLNRPRIASATTRIAASRVSWRISQGGAADRTSGASTAMSIILPPDGAGAAGYRRPP